MIRPSVKLAQYVSYVDGKVVFSKDLPKELKEEAREYEKLYKQTSSNDDLTEY